MNVADVLAALQLFVSQHPAGGAACVLLPANAISVTRSDFRAIIRADVRDEEVIVVLGGLVGFGRDVDLCRQVRCRKKRKDHYADGVYLAGAG